MLRERTALPSQCRESLRPHLHGNLSTELGRRLAEEIDEEDVELTEEEFAFIMDQPNVRLPALSIRME